MGHMFNSAAAAFKAGNIKEAKWLSAIGKEYKKKFHSLKEQNGQKVFSQLNNNQSLEDWVDLHGLHPQEALTFLDLAIIKI